MKTRAQPRQIFTYGPRGTLSRSEEVWISIKEEQGKHEYKEEIKLQVTVTAIATAISRVVARETNGKYKSKGVAQPFSASLSRVSRDFVRDTKGPQQRMRRKRGDGSSSSLVSFQVVGVPGSSS